MMVSIALAFVVAVGSSHCSATAAGCLSGRAGWAREQRRAGPSDRYARYSITASSHTVRTCRAQVRQSQHHHDEPHHDISMKATKK